MKVEQSIELGRDCLWLSPSEFSDGVEFAQKKGIKDFFLWYGKDCPDELLGKDLTIDFSWLQELPDTLSIEMTLNLTSKSNVNSFYSLKDLDSLVYFNYDKLPLEHSKLKKLRRLYTHYSKRHTEDKSSFEKIENLKELKLWHIKQEDCSFLGKLNKLEKLELTWSRKLQSLNGIEEFKNLSNLSLINLYTLVDITNIKNCTKLKGIWKEGCKHINEDGQKLIAEINQN